MSGNATANLNEDTRDSDAPPTMMKKSGNRCGSAHNTHGDGGQAYARIGEPESVCTRGREGTVEEGEEDVEEDEEWMEYDSIFIINT